IPNPYLLQVQYANTGTILQVTLKNFGNLHFVMTLKRNLINWNKRMILVSFDPSSLHIEKDFPWKLYYIKTAKLRAIGSELIFEEKECDQTKKENVSSIQPQKQEISNKMDTTSRVDVMDCN